MGDRDLTHQCPCGNVRVRVLNEDGEVEEDSLTVKFSALCLTLPSANKSDIVCINCASRVVADGRVAGGVPVSGHAHHQRDAVSECFGIRVAASPSPDIDQESRVRPEDVHVAMPDIHPRKHALRICFEDWKQNLLKETEERILQAQAQCAFLCDRIQELGGACESSKDTHCEHCDPEVYISCMVQSSDCVAHLLLLFQLPPTPNTAHPLKLVSATAAIAPLISPTAITQPSIPVVGSPPNAIPIPQPSVIFKEPIPSASVASPTVGSLLSRRISLAASAGSLNSNVPVNPPLLKQTIIPPEALLKGNLISGSLPSKNTAIAGAVSGLAGSVSNSSGNLSRKVHFKETISPTTTTSNAAATNTAADSSIDTAPANASGTMDPVKAAIKAGTFGKGSSKSLPSPAPPGGGVVVFGSKDELASGEGEDDGEKDDEDDEDLFGMDSGHGGSNARNADRYGRDTEDDEDDDNDEYDDAIEHQVSLLSSSVPVAIASDPRTGAAPAAYDRKPNGKKKSRNADDEEFIAPHEIVARSYQQQSGLGEMNASVIGKPVAASYKKSFVAL
ncbi:hypothetical protein BJ741DRAFT_629729 [Chytriomyces cf. hyalinus JEL632]|nr:hypothetical protein BJ741DRAFT_629729 [Chytriomyces cf. hyalinus JEL632]